ncbi:MAG: EamA family transporter [Arachnia sp.]
MRGQWVGTVLTLAAISSVQLGSAVSKAILDRIDPAGLTFARLAIAAAVLVIIARPRVRRWDRRVWLPVIALGASLAGMNWSFYMSLERIPLGVAVAAELMGPLVLSMSLTRRRSDSVWVGLAVAGALVLGLQSLRGGLDLVGLLFALLAGGFWAAYIVSSQRVGSRVPGVGGLAIAMAIGALLIAPLGLLRATAALAADSSILGWIMLVALLSSVVTYGLEMHALRLLPARIFGVLLAVEPAVAAMYGYLLIGERLGRGEWLAIVLVIAASIGITWTARRQEPAPVDGTQ